MHHFKFNYVPGGYSAQVLALHIRLLPGMVSLV